MYSTEEYKGCRNCKYQPEPMQTCDWIKHQKEVYIICPMWELKKDKDGRADNKRCLRPASYQQVTSKLPAS